MIIYTIARSAETVAFIKAAWTGDLPKTLYFVSNLIVSIAATICYLLVIYICWKMFKDYELMKEISENKQKAKKDIIETHMKQIIEQYDEEEEVRLSMVNGDARISTCSQDSADRDMELRFQAAVK